jgi:hypothetical protein
MKWEGCGIKQSWSILRHYLSNCLQQLRKIKKVSQDMTSYICGRSPNHKTQDNTDIIITICLWF